MKRLLTWAVVILLGATTRVGANQPVPAATPGTPGKASKTLKKKGKRSRAETEAEGTEAPNRFEADTVIKSRYQLNGEQLEVDPD